MLYHIFYPLVTTDSIFNVFQYITFRTVFATLTSMFLSFILGPFVIRALHKKQIGQNIRSDGPPTHLSKMGTPTMGGVLIIGCVLLPSFLWARLDVGYVWVALFIIASYGILGFIDDYEKLIKKNSKGLSAYSKIKYQALFAVVAMLILYILGLNSQIVFPFFKNYMPELGIFFVLWGVIVIVGASNAVNLTDGLDGLAIGPIITSALSFMVLSYVAGHSQIAEYLKVVHVAGAGELAIICGTIVGSGLGFLWYNSYPAQVFMGDVGSLPLGAALGVIAVITKSDLLLLLIGGIFVIEALSVIVQVTIFKLNGKRIFKMAPIHHHWEMNGWAEPKIIVRFWIISIILALLSLGTLKMR